MIFTGKPPKKQLTFVVVIPPNLTTMTIFCFFAALVFCAIHTVLFAQSTAGSSYNNADYKLKSAEITYDNRLDMLIFEMKVEGQAGRTVPKPIDKMDSAPVLAYVFPTTLKPTDVGFRKPMALWPSP